MVRCTAPVDVSCRRRCFSHSYSFNTMRSFLPSLLVVALGLGACRGQPEPGTRAADSTGRDGTSSPSSDPQAMNASAESPAEGGYRLLGVLDPERGNLVAFAMKVPRSWQAKQTFTRRWVGAMPQNQIYLDLRAPDGRTQIEYLPSRTYNHADGPTIRQTRGMEQSMGLPISRLPDELPPMPPVTYIRQVLLPFLAQNGFQLRNVGNEMDAPQRRNANGQMESRGSVDGTLPNGNRARVECRITRNVQQIGNDTYTTWMVIPSITQTADDLDTAHGHTVVAQESIVMNPTWMEQNQAAQTRGAQANSELSRQQHEATMGQIDANTAAMTRGHNARMNDIQQQGVANTARHNDRMAAMDRDKAAFDNRMGSMDRQQETRIDGIRGEANYVDPTTGERVKLQDGSNHVYRDNRNPTQYYGTDTPIDAGRIDWQELQKVSLPNR